MKNLVFVGARAHALHGNGKASTFFQYADSVFRSYGIDVFKYKNFNEFELNIDKHRDGIVTMIYNEEDGIEEAEQIERICMQNMRRALIVHPSKLGRVIGDKAATNTLLADNGIRVPKQIKSEAAIGQVFSNDPLGSGRTVSVHAPGEKLRFDRYNTEFINTVYPFRGRDYYVSLRAMCVGGTCIAIYTRCRPTEEGNPSVHTTNTPVDPELINYLHVRVAIRLQGKIIQVCEQIGQVIGLGFFSHDLLPCADTGEVFICETGVKFDEATLMNRLTPVRNSVVIQDVFNGVEIKKSAHEFVRAANEMGFLR
ncbi:hypothetical protein [Microvirga terrestris]|uniref:Gfo/Idh/MocA-like oxidoreductase N-terminal domain-containing protein n=1 Tax=Microvirga terrestris TaxID=2791024 RepID=A0ABS0HV46_9HYPH|nr:hypothetical protein [Microvirga terrestris]MBF9197343.1 hypothetical protein [Microvirga terrestris]